MWAKVDRHESKKARWSSCALAHGRINLFLVTLLGVRCHLRVSIWLFVFFPRNCVGTSSISGVLMEALKYSIRVLARDTLDQSPRPCGGVTFQSPPVGVGCKPVRLPSISGPISNPPLMQLCLNWFIVQCLWKKTRMYNSRLWTEVFLPRILRYFFKLLVPINLSTQKFDMFGRAKFPRFSTYMSCLSVTAAEKPKFARAKLRKQSLDFLCMVPSWENEKRRVRLVPFLSTGRHDQAMGLLVLYEQWRKKEAVTDWDPVTISKWRTFTQQGCKLTRTAECAHQKQFFEGLPPVSIESKYAISVDLVIAL